MASDSEPAKKKSTLAANEEEEEEQQHQQQGQDFISGLPDEILHAVLSKLEIRDAAVTTGVSKRWALLFPSLPSLIIDADSFNPLDPDRRPGRYNQYVEDRSNWLKALYAVLDSRRTPVKRFKIGVDILEPEEDEFYNVFRTVCASGVEELSIDDTDHDCCYRVPSPVFACNSVVKLEIDSCKLVVPSKLTGLRGVKSLVLLHVRVADDHLCRMISRCKAMEKLVITDCHKVDSIVIRAPNLSELVISLCRPIKIVLKSAPKLASASVAFGYSYFDWKNSLDYIREKEYDSDECVKDYSSCSSDETFKGTGKCKNLVAFLNGLRGVKDLHLDFASDYRKVDDYMMQSSNGNGLELDFWEKQPPPECVKLHLTTATFYLHSSEDCFVFPKFLLLNAGKLKNMNVLCEFWKNLLVVLML